MAEEEPSSNDAFRRIRRAVEARDRFLKEHPELQPLQDEITQLMRNMGNPHNRLVMLDSMLHERVLELQRRLIELREAFLASMAAIDDARAMDHQPDEGEIVSSAPPAESDIESEVPPAESDIESDVPPAERGKILGPADAWPVPDGLTGRDRPDRPPRGHPRRIPPPGDENAPPDVSAGPADGGGPSDE